MATPSNQRIDVDASTSRAVTRGVGEKLRQLLADHPAQFPTRLQLLLEQLRLQEKKRNESADKPPR